MKKNIMMRIASVLLVAVLLSTSAISGTFAKYVSSTTVTDSARVAKWGITTDVEGDNAFSATYNTDSTETIVLRNGSNLEVAVASNDGANVVAPGTSGTFASVSMAGNPEVAVKVEHSAVMTLEGWTVQEGSDSHFYCPITISFTRRALDANGDPAFEDDGITPKYEEHPLCGLDYETEGAFILAVKKEIAKDDGVYDANANLESILSYDWEWAFEGTKGTYIDQTDAYDTQLGNLADAPTISLEVTTTIVQVD